MTRAQRITIARLNLRSMPMDTDKATETVDNPQEEMADMMKMSPSMLRAIRMAPKGKLPPVIEKKIAKKKKSATK